VLFRSHEFVPPVVREMLPAPRAAADPPDAAAQRRLLAASLLRSPGRE